MVLRRRWLFIGGGALLLLALFVVSRSVCLGAWIKRGVVVESCPDGELRQTLFVDCQGLRRGAPGTVRVGATAHYTIGDSDARLTAPVRRMEPALALVKGGKEEVTLVPTKGWRGEEDFIRAGEIVLPKDLPDGDYLLRARVRSPLGEDVVDVPLPLYAPARVHVITDRPLYEPGNTVQFRAVALRATDFVPTDGRPGKWVVTDPSGEVVLEERAPAGAYGVVPGTFPLDGGAPSGEWHVRWESGGAQDEVGFRVEPFTLPRFRVEASAARPFYRAGDRPRLAGKVVYGSGAPVPGAEVNVLWVVKGAWPPPAEWQAGGLPTRAVSDASGAFALLLPVVPRDLEGRVTLDALLSASDPAGDRVEGRASLLLSKDAIQVATVTELAGGLVAGFNNRLYLRATTAAGAVLARVELLVKRAWEPNDRGVTATTDEDGVAALQLDPGPAVNVVVPPMPFRPPAREPPIVRGEISDLTGGETPLADQLALDRWNVALAPCARLTTEPTTVTLAVQANATGAVTATAMDGSPLSACLASGLRRARLSAGRERVYRVGYTVRSDLPRLKLEINGVPSVPGEIDRALKLAALDARSCLPEDSAAAPLPRVLVWKARKKVTATFVRDPVSGREAVRASVAGCVERKLLAARSGDLDDESAEYLGTARVSVQPSPRFEQERPQATTVIGYELLVTARGQQGDLGGTRLLIEPGQVPPLRLRAIPVLAEPGGTVDVAILRGPGFTGALPKILTMTHRHASLEAKVDEKTRTARFALPADAVGWFQVMLSGSRALVYVRPRTELAVSVAPGAERYQPGKMAELAIRTSTGGRGTPAAVGLFGVDASLAQLVPLPGPDDMARLRPKPSMIGPAFDALEASALELGRVRGANAASATVLRVNEIPAPATLDASVSATARPTFDPVEALTDHFYTVLSELHARVRAWEASAPRAEQMHPPTMAKLWLSALDACEKRQEPVTDAYGRRLQLHRLPPDLLALTDPRALVVDGTRLPEDVESWPGWVAKERP